MLSEYVERRDRGRRLLGGLVSLVGGLALVGRGGIIEAQSTR